MQVVEEFTHQYFRELSALHRRELETLVPFRRKFYTEGCRILAGREAQLNGVILQNERIVQVSHSESGADVMVCSGGATLRTRYRLLRSHDGWLIDSVAIECPRCQGKPGVDDCSFCRGQGWSVHG